MFVVCVAHGDNVVLILTLYRPSSGAGHQSARPHSFGSELVGPVSNQSDCILGRRGNTKNTTTTTTDKFRSGHLSLCLKLQNSFYCCEFCSFTTIRESFFSLMLFCIKGQGSISFSRKMFHFYQFTFAKVSGCMVYILSCFSLSGSPTDATGQPEGSGRSQFCRGGEGGRV